MFHNLKKSKFKNVYDFYKKKRITNENRNTNSKPGTYKKTGEK
jgi:hypothetical protein